MQQLEEPGGEPRVLRGEGGVRGGKRGKLGRRGRQEEPLLLLPPLQQLDLPLPPQRRHFKCLR